MGFSKIHSAPKSGFSIFRNMRLIKIALYRFMALLSRGNIYVWLFLSLITIVACSTNDNADNKSASDDQTMLSIKYDQTQLKDRPGIAGQTKSNLPKGSKLIDLNETSAFTTPLKLAGTDCNEPWIKVKTVAGEVGWVYAAMLRFEGERSPNYLINRQLKALFGEGLFRKIESYQDQFKTVKTSNDFVETYRSGTHLRDSIEQYLHEKWIVSDTESLPDLFWLNKVLPAFIIQLTTDGKSYKLYKDYKAFFALAQKTKEKDDNDYINACLEVFPDDSIEYNFPVWTIQTTDDSGHSLLGRGYHFNTLSDINTLLSKKTPFYPEIKDIKEELINDICNENVTYWESRTEILNELDRILEGSLNVLINSDLIALKTRRSMFEQSEQNGIKLNYKTGM